MAGRPVDVEADGGGPHLLSARLKPDRQRMGDQNGLASTQSSIEDFVIRATEWPSPAPGSAVSTAVLGDYGLGEFTMTRRRGEKSTSGSWSGRRRRRRHPAGGGWWLDDALLGNWRLMADMCRQKRCVPHDLGRGQWQRPSADSPGLRFAWPGDEGRSCLRVQLGTGTWLQAFHNAGRRATYARQSCQNSGGRTGNCEEKLLEFKSSRLASGIHGSW
ncbi:hypothetical protein QBC47DRAFT_360476 [Echria macrotheca]|uniref:Uncharacterized protein n=1 Tax=Echria macrotheca TaxID=438768 RepID=A0AAJ0FBW1_9PEZI|nr:hypothetical protein QBC47DRAFT_360476 [Echria macrotheca]